MTSRGTARLYRQHLHPLMSGGVSGLLTLTAVMLARDAFGAPAPPVAVVPLLALTGVTEAVAGNIFHELRSDASARLRELIVLLGVAYLTAAVGAGGGLAARFTPGALHGVLLGATALHWMVASRMHGYLRQREDFLFSIADKSRAEIRSDIRSTRGYTLGVFRSLQRVRGQVVGYFVMVTAGFIVLWGVSEVPRPLTLTAFAASAIATAVVVFATNLWLEEYAASADGLAVPRRFERRRLVAAGAVLGAGAVVALAASGNASLLNLELFGALAEWISGWFTSAPGATERVRDIDFLQYFPAAEQLAGARDAEVSEFWRGFAVVFRWTVIGLFALALLAFVAAPLFSRHFRRDVERAALRTRIRNALVRLVIVLWRTRRRLRRTIRALFHGGSARPDEDEADRGTAGRTADAAIHHPPPLRLRRQRSTLRSLYQELLRWARQRGIDHGRAETVREFTRRLAKTHPEICREAPAAGQILTHALYARHPLSRESLSEYRRVVKGIVKVGDRS